MIRQELYLASPYLNAAGTLGYTPPARWPVEGMDLKILGAFVTNPISPGPRTPAAERTQISYPGGALLHSGLPNPGLNRVLRTYSERWAQAVLPVWVHLFASKPDEIRQMVRRLEEIEGVMAVELGLAPDAGPDDWQVLVEAAYGELPLIVQLPLHAVGEAWVSRLVKSGVSALSLGAPRGTLLNTQDRPVSGRLCGPSLLPQTMLALKSALQLGIPVIAGAGVYRRQDAQTLLEQGAFAIRLDTVLWRGWMD